MITFISRSTELLTGMLAGLLIAAAAPVMADSGILEARLLQASGEPLPRYNLHLGLNPEKACLNVRYYADANTRLHVQIRPRVGLTGWTDNEGITDKALLESSATWMQITWQTAEILKAANPGQQCVQVPIRSELDSWALKGLWPVELELSVVLEPSGKEKTLADNVTRILLPADPAD